MSNGTPKTDAGDKGKIQNKQTSKVCNLWDPQPMITIKAGNLEWIVHKNILTHGSEYFRKALDGPFQENVSKTVSLGNNMITSVDLGRFISMMYASAMNTESIIPDCNLVGNHWLRSRIGLWITADYFQHEIIKERAVKTFEHTMARRERALGRGKFPSKDEKERDMEVQNFVEGWKACEGCEPAALQFRPRLAVAFARSCCREALDLFLEKAPQDMIKEVSKKLHELKSK